MDSQSGSTRQTVVEVFLAQSYSLVPLMRLEYEHPEEQAIRELEIKISNEQDNNGGNVGSLIKDRRQKYNEWIGRLKKEISEESGGSESKKLNRLRQTLNRAIREYGQPFCGEEFSQVRQ